MRLRRSVHSAGRCRLRHRDSFRDEHQPASKSVSVTRGQLHLGTGCRHVVCGLWESTPSAYSAIAAVIVTDGSTCWQWVLSLSDRNRGAEVNMQARKLCLITPLVISFSTLAGCGVPTVEEGSSGPTRRTTAIEMGPTGTAGGRATGSPSAVTVDIPSRASSDDWRGPLERFLGVPHDVGDAVRLAHEMTEVAIAECMARHGYSHVPVPFGAERDPNETFWRGLTAAAFARYASTRWTELESDGSDASCETEGTRRVYVLNTMAAAYAPYEARFASDPRVVEARRRVTECVTRRSATGEPFERNEIISCQHDTGWAMVAIEVTEEVQRKFVTDYAAELLAFIENMPKVRS